MIDWSIAVFLVALAFALGYGVAEFIHSLR